MTAITGREPGAVVVRTQADSGHRVCIDCHGWGRPENNPAVIVKDEMHRVLAMIAAGDTLAAHDTTGLVDPSWVASIEVVKSAAAVATLGPGFENGILIITLTPAGSEAWRQRRSRRSPSKIGP